MTSIVRVPNFLVVTGSTGCLLLPSQGLLLLISSPEDKSKIGRRV